MLLHMASAAWCVKCFSRLLGKNGRGAEPRCSAEGGRLRGGGRQKPDKHRCALESRDKERGDEDQRSNELVDAESCSELLSKCLTLSAATEKLLFVSQETGNAAGHLVKQKVTKKQVCRRGEQAWRSEENTLEDVSRARWVGFALL